MKQIVYIASIVLILGGCVSNKSFKMEQAKAQELEQKQTQLTEQIEALRSDLLIEQQALTRINANLTDIDALRVLPQELQGQVSTIKATVDSLEFKIEQKVPLLQDNVAYIMERITTLQEEFADNNQILLDLGKRMDILTAKMQAPKPDLSKYFDTNTASSNTVKDPQNDASAVQIKTPKVAKAHAQVKQTIQVVPVQTLEEREVNADEETERLIMSYRYAKAKFDEGDFNAAIVYFTDIKRAYADDPYAANAQYWIAESYYSMSQYSTALPAFRLVLKDYPKSPKAPDAMLKIARCYEQLEDYNSARETYTELKMVYPGYERSALVDKFLMELPK